MKKIIPLILIISLLTSTQVFAESIPKAYSSKNMISAPAQIKYGQKLTFTPKGDRQNAIGHTDYETRYIPNFYEIEGPDYYYTFGVYYGSTYTKSIKPAKPGKYKIKIQFSRESYDSYVGWLLDDSYDTKTKIVTVQNPKYKITLNANKGKIGKKKKIKKSIIYSKKYGKLKKAKRSGYKFKGWYTKKKGGKKITSSSKVKNLKSHTLYAQWKKVKSKSKVSKKSSNYVYITKTGEKYHRSNCRYLSSSKIKIALKKAKAQGYGACKVCKP